MRAELLGQVVGAQFELERALAEMPVQSRVEGIQQLASLKALQRQIGSANPAMLHALRADIAGAIAIAHAAAQQSQSAATNAEGIALLVEAASASREQVRATMENMHRYDSFLQFGPGDSEADYLQREAERRRYIDAEQAKHTPTGDLNAAGGTMGQMVDAKAHGAGDSPEFKAQWDTLVETTEKLRDAVRRDGGSTAEFDKRLRDDLRRTLRAKGFSTAQIEAQFAVHPDPLDAAKAFVADDRDLQAIRDVALKAEKLSSVPIIAADAAPRETHVTNVMAKLRASGIIAAEISGDLAHGVVANAQFNRAHRIV